MPTDGCGVSPRIERNTSNVATRPWDLGFPVDWAVASFCPCQTCGLTYSPLRRFFNHFFSSWEQKYSRRWDDSHSKPIATVGSLRSSEAYSGLGKNGRVGMWHHFEVVSYYCIGENAYCIYKWFTAFFPPSRCLQIWCCRERLICILASPK